MEGVYLLLISGFAKSQLTSDSHGYDPKYRVVATFPNHSVKLQLTGDRPLLQDPIIPTIQ